MYSHKFMAPMFELLEQCRGVPQMDIHHPEGDVLNHSLQVMEWAFRDTNDLDLIFAAMFHDVGKSIIRKGHEKESVEMMRPFATSRTLWLIDNHMRYWHLVLGETRRKQKINDLVRNPWFPDLAMLCRWDKMGRNPYKHVVFDKDRIIDRLNERSELKYKNIDFSERQGIQND